MKPHIDLASWPNASDLVPKTPAGQALDSKLVSETDLVRLKVIAQLHARGLPPDIGWADLLQEAFTRFLEGTRIKPDGVPMVAFLAGVMRSLREQYWRQARKRSRQMPRLLADLELAGANESELPDPAPNPERRAIAMQAMESMQQVFSDDVQALQIIAGLFDGLSPEETCTTYGMAKTDYDSTRRRMRRTLVRAGLRLPQP
jgi:DNA-directed RNA polymerase specialized sigma24 family protein